MSAAQFPSLDPVQIAALLPTKLPHVACTETVRIAVEPGKTAAGRKPSLRPPGLAVASFFPEITALFGPADHTNGAISGEDRVLSARILAYLRAVRGGVLLGTIVARVGESDRNPLAEKRVADAVKFLLRVGAIRREESLYFIAWGWRHILPDVLTVDTFEVASHGEQDAEEQNASARRLVCHAAAHRRFAHHAFVALPGPLADRLRTHAVFRDRGVGLLKVASDNTVSVLVNSPKQLPSSWLSYYRIALSLPVGTMNTWTYPELFSTT